MTSATIAVVAALAIVAVTIVAAPLHMVSASAVARP